MEIKGTAMEIKVQNFGCYYGNDTLVYYVNTGLYSSISCSFVSEDPDCGIETIAYQVTEKPAPMDQLAYELLQEVKDVLDYRDGVVEATTKVPVECLDEYDDCTTTSLIAFEHALAELSKGYTPVVRNKDGNVIQIVTVEQAADIVLGSLASNSNVTGFDVLSGDIDGHDITEFVGNNSGGTWYGIKWIPLDMFDGNKADKLVIIGHYGGGYAESIYINAEKNYSKPELVKKMCWEFDAQPNEKILLETKTVEAK